MRPQPDRRHKYLQPEAPGARRLSRKPVQRARLCRRLRRLRRGFSPPGRTPTRRHRSRWQWSRRGGTGVGLDSARGLIWHGGDLGLIRRCCWHVIVFFDLWDEGTLLRLGCLQALAQPQIRSLSDGGQSVYASTGKPLHYADATTSMKYASYDSLQEYSGTLLLLLANEKARANAELAF